MGYIAVEPNVYVNVTDLNPTAAKTIFWIHGWPGNHNLFEYQLSRFPAMGYRCVAMDCRGFGLSDKPWGGYGYNRLADDVRAVIDAMQLKNVTLAGHSTGGAIAIRYMARHSGHEVSKLALFAAAAPSLIQRSDFPYGLNKQAVLDIIQGTNTDRPQMLRNFGSTVFYHKVSAPLSDWIFQMGLEATNWSTSAVAQTWIDEVLFDDMAKISVPTLILHGLNDRVCLFPLATAQNKGIRGSKLVPFSQCGHFLFYDQMDRFNKEFAAFLQT